MHAALDVEDALIVSLSRLRLGQVLGQKCNRPHYPSGDINLGGGQDLRALLQTKHERQMMKYLRVKQSSKDMDPENVRTSNAN